MMALIERTWMKMATYMIEHLLKGARPFDGVELHELSLPLIHRNIMFELSFIIIFSQVNYPSLRMVELAKPSQVPTTDGWCNTELDVGTLLYRLNRPGNILS